ncbi:cytochrome c maturation protein CcmE [Demequina sp. TTPB684]|uniref:cytochrome c maturation protein CcmE n=1 Tax=unclassified Demequina TaxID=2620311 RepID=UPI001CF237D4|nr:MULTISPECIES: cytochrome c maturation protein CcmE [unclassified Demequina]MCB2412543.1 cytochrome c maturation protein CcmE [Demequina sp. TTPB684]UPU87801.1 cytochrome c maturation protein CcmE [Demequina sp. TMPB413]
MKYRAIVIPVIGVIAVLTGFLVFGNLNQNLVYYLTPTEATDQRDDTDPGQRFRLGGLVEEGSVIRTGDEVRFTLVDAAAAVPVVYAGIPQQLFAPGVGAIVEGAWNGNAFYADTMIIKHDEEYQVPEPDTAGTADEVDP